MAEDQTTAPPEDAKEADPTAGRVTRVQGSVIDVCLLYTSPSPRD